AEDGIRDRTVTGVQTCALPILQCGEIALVLRRSAVAKAPVAVSLVSRTGMPLAVPALRNTKMPNYEVTGAVPPSQVKVRANLDRSEERRVGKEGGGRGVGER